MGIWPQEIIDQLKALAGQGYSASICASHFNGMTRNAAVGIAFRNKFQFHGSSGGTGGGARTVRKRSATRFHPQDVREPIIELPRMVTMEELRSEDCRFIF